MNKFFFQVVISSFNGWPIFPTYLNQRMLLGSHTIREWQRLIVILSQGPQEFVNKKESFFYLFSIGGVGCLLRVHSSSKEGSLPGIHFFLSLTTQLELLAIFVHVPAFWIKKGERVSSRHESLEKKSDLFIQFKIKMGNAGGLGEK